MTKRWLLMWYNGFEYEKHSYFDTIDDIWRWFNEQGHLLQPQWPQDVGTHKHRSIDKDGLEHHWAFVDTRVPPPEGPPSRIVVTNDYPPILGWGILLFVIVFLVTGLLSH